MNHEANENNNELQPCSIGLSRREITDISEQRQTKQKLQTGNKLIV